jgi:hypothetical protein
MIQAKYLIPKYFLPGQLMSIWLCHDENQKHKITHEGQQNRKLSACSPSPPTAGS